MSPNKFTTERTEDTKKTSFYSMFPVSAVINGFSDLIIELWGSDAGAHARSAVGMASLPMDIPVEIEAEVEIAL